MSTAQVKTPFVSIWSLQWRWAAIKNGIHNALAYRGDFIVGILGSALVPVAIQLILWNAIYKASGNSLFAGMSYSQMIAYTWTSLLFSQIRGGDYDFALAEMIRTGELSNFLLRPVGVVEFTFFQGFGERLLNSTFFFSLGLIATLFTDMNPLNLLLGMTLALMGNIIHYLFGAMLAVVAFYWENAFSILMVKNMVVSLLSGELIPLNIFPEKYEWIWRSTPFYLYVFGPAQVALGNWDHATWAKQMLLACAWLLGFWALVHMLWKRAIRHYQGIGG